MLLLRFRTILFCVVSYCGIGAFLSAYGVVVSTVSYLAFEIPWIRQLDRVHQVNKYFAMCEGAKRLFTCTYHHGKETARLNPLECGLKEASIGRQSGEDNIHGQNQHSQPPPECSQRHLDVGSSFWRPRLVWQTDEREEGSRPLGEW